MQKDCICYMEKESGRLLQLQDPKAFTSPPPAFMSIGRFFNIKNSLIYFN